jgi:hypothetical protein
LIENGPVRSHTPGPASCLRNSAEGSCSSFMSYAKARFGAGDQMIRSCGKANTLQAPAIRDHVLLPRRRRIGPLLFPGSTSHQALNFASSGQAHKIFLGGAIRGFSSAACVF